MLYLEDNYNETFQNMKEVEDFYLIHNLTIKILFVRTEYFSKIELFSNKSILDGVFDEFDIIDRDPNFIIMRDITTNKVVILLERI
jgi:hypothetical protein